MPQTQTYQVTSDAMLPRRQRRVTRPRTVEETPAQLPTPKEPAAAVAPLYNVQPQDDLIGASSFAGKGMNWRDVAAMDDTYDDPAITALNRAADSLEAARNAPVKKISRGMAALKMAGTALGQTQGGDSWSDVARQLGSAAGGAVTGAVQPKLPGAVQKLYNVQEAERKLATTQKYAATASLGNYRGASLDLRREKMNADAAYKEWQKADKTRLTDNTLNRTAFLQDYMKHKQLSTDVQNAFMNSIRTEDAALRKKKFDFQQESTKINQDIAQRRTAAYEQAVANSGNNQQAKFAADAAEGQALLDAADDYDDVLGSMNPDEDYEEIIAIKKEQRAMRRKGEGLTKGAAAGSAVKTAAPVQSTPVRDTTKKGGGVRPKVSTQKLQSLLGVQ